MAKILRTYYGLFNALKFSCTCLIDVDGKKLPTELKAEASQLRKKMKFDDSEREGVHLYYFCACTFILCVSAFVHVNNNVVAMMLGVPKACKVL